MKDCIQEEVITPWCYVFKTHDADNPAEPVKQLGNGSLFKGIVVAVVRCCYV
jgi:hypothetical protein